MVLERPPWGIAQGRNQSAAPRVSGGAPPLPDAVRRGRGLAAGAARDGGGDGGALGGAARGAQPRRAAGAAGPRLRQHDPGAGEGGAPAPGLGLGGEEGGSGPCERCAGPPPGHRARSQP